MRNRICSRIIESTDVQRKLLDISSVIEHVVTVMLKSLKCGGKILLLGNGGSASDCQHFAAELIGRFYKDRKALPAIDLTSNGAILTAVSNDFGYESTFTKQIEAFATEKDVVIAFSTSGNSANILAAIQKAKEKGSLVVGFTGHDGGKMKSECDIIVQVESSDTPRIQEGHGLIIHIVCELVEEKMIEFYSCYETKTQSEVFKNG